MSASGVGDGLAVVDRLAAAGRVGVVDSPGLVHRLCADDFRLAVEAVLDPELGDVTIGELGLVHEVRVVDSHVDVLLRPTFLGCPALQLLANDVRSALLGVGASTTEVRFVHTPAWGPEHISEEGRRKLGLLGIAVAETDSVVCPYCASADLRPAAPVGPTSCRSVAFCGGCRSIVEIMRGPGTTAGSNGTALPVSIVAKGNYANV